MKFSEVVRLLEANGFWLVKEKGSIRYYGKDGWQRLISRGLSWRQGNADRNVPRDPEAAGIKRR